MPVEKRPDELSELEQQFPAPQVRVSNRRGWVKLGCALVLASCVLYQLADLGCMHSSEQGAARPLSAADYEKIYLSVPEGKSALAASRQYATHPHIASSQEDYEDALVILKLFQDEFDIPAPEELPVFPAGSAKSRAATLNIPTYHKPTAWVDAYYPIMNTGIDQALQILDEDGNALWDADLVEDGDPADPEAAKYRDSVPTWHGLSADGDVQGQLIYANYGRQEDYQELLAKGTNFTGKIVLTRYGGIFRGLKIKGAWELGAAGVLVYSDPRDDGHVTVDNGYAYWPHGPARNPTSVQRGSVQYISMYPGDPTTPGYPAYENATRTEAESIPKIPSLPISWANAQRLLSEISAEDDARKLTGTASKSTIRLLNHVDTKVMPIWNTAAVIPGHNTNESVVIGVHRDAWVMGAADPTSGTVSLHEVIRGFGTLLKHGWKPLRTVVIISWDAEEYGLVGSTEWAEDFSEWIVDNVVAYINLDVSVSGSQWNTGASPSLAHLIRQAAHEVPHPTKPGKTLWDAREDVGPFAEGAVDAESLTSHPTTQRARAAHTGVGALGSGSDFTPFLQHLGIPSMDQGFGGTLSDAVYHYHSIYDSQRWQEVYADPDFSRHVACAKHLGLVALRLANTFLLPLNTTQYALELNDYLEEVEDVAASLAFTVDFSPLRKAIHNVQHASIQLDKDKYAAEKTWNDFFDSIPKPKDGHIIRRWIKWLLGLGKHNRVHDFVEAGKRIQKANQKLVAFEKGFISEDGIKDREWYRHLGVAPGKWLGYGATTFPSVYDALVFDKNTTAASLEVERVSAMLNKLADTLVE